MKEIKQLIFLYSEAKVQLNVLAQFCNCSPTAIANYIKGNSLPSGSKLLAIRDGLQKYKKLINEIIKE